VYRKIVHMHDFSVEHESGQAASCHATPFII
jgi:hypothetical protein